MLPFFVWGVYTLRVRFRYHDDFAPMVEVLTLLGVTVFLGVETVMLRTWMTNTPVLYLFTILGLLVSSAALYGSMMVSVASHIMVNMVLPGEPRDPSSPHFAPAEALERIGDYDSALQEYMVMARIFPKDGSTATRIANCLIRLDRLAEASKAFERALTLIEDEEPSLRVTNRLVEIYERKMDRPDDAARVLQLYIENFPHAERIQSVRERLGRLRQSMSHASTRPSAPEASPPRDLSV